MGCCQDNSDDCINISDPKLTDQVYIDDDYSHPKDPWYKHSTPTFWSEDPVPIQVQLVHLMAKAPEKAHTQGDMGWDIFCVDDENWGMCNPFGSKKRCLELMPFESYTFSTGIKIAVPHNYGFLLRERSGLGVKDFGLGAGVIEGTYRGEWRIHIRNQSKKPRQFFVGDKICQAILVPIIPAKISMVEGLPDTERGESGFGSSDSK